MGLSWGQQRWQSKSYGWNSDHVQLKSGARNYSAVRGTNFLFYRHKEKRFTLWSCHSTASSVPHSFGPTLQHGERTCSSASPVWQLMCGDRHCYNRPKTLSLKFLPFSLSYPISAIELLAEKKHSKERKNCLLETPLSNPTGDIWSSDEASDSQLPSHTF